VVKFEVAAASTMDYATDKEAAPVKSDRATTIVWGGEWSYTRVRWQIRDPFQGMLGRVMIVVRGREDRGGNRRDQKELK